MSKQNTQPWLRSIQGQKEKVWYYTTADGKQRSLGFKESEKEEAFKKWHGIMATAGVIPQEEATNLQTLITTFLALLLPRVSKKYYECMRATLKELLLLFPNWSPSKFTSCDLEEWLDLHDNWNVSTKYANRNHLVSFFKWLKRKKLIDENPASEIRSYRPKARGKEVIIEDGDFQKFFSKCEKHFAALVMVLWQTGARPSEIRELLIEEVDFQHKIIHKMRHKMSHKGKTRKIILSDEAVQILTAVIGTRTSGAVFLSREGRMWTAAGFLDRWRRARRAAALPPTWTPYAVRHCWCVMMCRKGVPAAVIATMMGHSSAKMIESVYGHMLDDIDSYRKWL
jgi:integrase